MRHTIAVILLAILSAQIALPFAIVGSESHIPACCRRAGTHHCTMAASHPEHGPEWSAVKSKCPAYPKASSAAHSPHLLSISTNGAQGELDLSSYTGITQEEAGYQASIASNNFERGPPPPFAY